MAFMWVYTTCRKILQQIFILDACLRRLTCNKYSYSVTSMMLTDYCSPTYGCNDLFQKGSRSVSKCTRPSVPMRLTFVAFLLLCLFGFNVIQYFFLQKEGENSCVVILYSGQYDKRTMLLYGRKNTACFNAPLRSHILWGISNACA